MSVYSRPLRFVFTALMLPALILCLAEGCSSAIGGPAPVPTSSAAPPTPPPSGVLLTGAATKLEFVSQGQGGAIVVPPQIGVPANDYATVAAGPSPQASMRPIPLVPGPFYTNPIVYTAVTFTRRTTTQQALGLTFDLPASINANFGTFYLAVYKAPGYWFTVATKHVASGQTVSFAPTGAKSTYGATLPHGIALWQLADVEKQMPQPNPSTLPFTALGQKGKIDVMEPDYYGAWTAVSSNPSVATVSPASGGPRFTVTALKAGKARVTFTDSAGGTGSTSVGVTTSGGGIH
jgi:Bacterial Ig-like domain (group 2)